MTKLEPDAPGAPLANAGEAAAARPAAPGPQNIWGAVGGLLQTQRQSAPLRVAPRDQPLPLSEAQRRLWFIQQTDPEAVTYQLNTAWRLNGPLNVPAFMESLRAVVRRHEVFRTTFTAVDGWPRLVIYDPWSLEVPVVDLEPLPAGERETAWRRQGDVEMRVPFDQQPADDVRIDPRPAVVLAALADDEHVELVEGDTPEQAEGFLE